VPTVSLGKFHFNVSPRVSMFASAFAIAFGWHSSQPTQRRRRRSACFTTSPTERTGKSLCRVTVGPEGPVRNGVRRGTGAGGAVFKLTQVGLSWVFSPCTNFPRAATDLPRWRGSARPKRRLIWDDLSRWCRLRDGVRTATSGHSLQVRTVLLERNRTSQLYGCPDGNTRNSELSLRSSWRHLRHGS